MSTTATTESFSAAFTFESKYITVLGSKMHYIEEGQGNPILFLHGNPTSSYLWRNVIPHLQPLGRCIALDLIGMGKSDKPDISYSFFDHAQYVDGFIDALRLKDITLVIHDWGSGLGFHYARRHEQNIKGLAFMEALVAPILSWDAFPEKARTLFQQFRTPGIGWDLVVNQNAFVEQFLPGATLRKLSQEEMEHYREPFREAISRKPVWRWPNELPIAGEPANVTAAVTAYNQWLQQSPLPKLLLYAIPGALITTSEIEWCKQHLPNLSTIKIGAGFHFLQEEHPHRIGTAIANWYKNL